MAVRTTPPPGSVEERTANGCPTSHIPTLYQAALTGEPYPVKGLLLFGNNSLMEIADSAKARQVFESMDFISCMDSSVCTDTFPVQKDLSVKLQAGDLFS